MTRPIPEWFTIAEEANPQVMQRIAEAVSSNTMTWQVKSAAMLAHWFTLDSLLLANQANRDGMHANALALTRQCLEAIGIIELGIYDDVEPGADLRAILELTPRAYDPQKATRITLFHALLHYTLGRVWIAANVGDAEFAALINRLGVALGKSRYLDGHQTNWSQQFWAMLWERGGSTILE